MENNENKSTDAEALSNELVSLAEATVQEPQSQDASETSPDASEASQDRPDETASRPSLTQEQSQPSQPTDEDQALFDRAIRAGLSSEDVRSIKSKDAIARIVEIAEKANAISQPKQDQTDVGAGNPDDDTAESVYNEMKEDGGYDARLMKFAGRLVEAERKAISARKSAERQAFIDKQLGSLDKDVAGHVDAAHMSKLNAKFNLLKAGYSSQGANVSDEEVFQEAARLALGDLIGKAAEDRKASALEKRRNLALSRPGGESGRHGGATAEDDPFADFVAAMG